MDEHFPRLNGKSIAYFSAEFALHQSLPIYAGGLLGVLAGDHCKEASDLGVPLIGVGFMPRRVIFTSICRRKVGRKRAERLDWADAPIEPAMTQDGKPVSPQCRSAIERCWPPSGESGWAA